MGSPGRIALLCQHFYPELISTGMHMTELATRLSAHGWDITVVCAQPTLHLASANERVPRRAEHAGVHIRRAWAVGSHRSLPARAVFATTYLASTLLDVVRMRRRVDGLLITTNPPFLGVIGRIAKALFGLKYVMIVYDVYPDLAGRLGVIKPGGVVYRLWDRVTTLALRGAETIVVIGRDMRSLVTAKVPGRSGSITTIPNWSDETNVAPVSRDENPFRERHARGASFVVQYAGRMARTHDLEPLVEAAALLRDRPVLFQFIGDGAKRVALEERADELGLDNVQFLPYQPIESLGEVLSAADVSVVCLAPAFTGVSVPSKAYGIMAAGTALLGFVDRSSEIGAMVEELDCGVVLEAPTPEEVARLITSLMTDPERVSRLGENGRRAFMERYTLEAAARRYASVLQDAF